MKGLSIYLRSSNHRITDIPTSVQWERQTTHLTKSWIQSLDATLSKQTLVDKIKVFWWDGGNRIDSPKHFVKPTDSCFRLVGQKLQNLKSKTSTLPTGTESKQLAAVQGRPRLGTHSTIAENLMRVITFRTPRNYMAKQYFFQTLRLLASRQHSRDPQYFLPAHAEKIRINRIQQPKQVLLLLKWPRAKMSQCLSSSVGQTPGLRSLTASRS